MREMLNTRNVQFSQSKKIVDVGEKIEGARKDILKAFASLSGDVTKERLAANPLSRVFKKLNLDSAVKSGALREIDALFYDATIRSIKGRKPSVSRIDLELKRMDRTYDALMRLRRFVLLDANGRDRLLKEFRTKRFANIVYDKEDALGWLNPDGSKLK